MATEKIKQQKKSNNNNSEKKTYNYHSGDCFDFKPVMFDNIKHLGFNPMHKAIRVVENIAHMAEQKYAKIHHSNLYCGENYVKTKTKNTRAEAVSLAHKHFKTEFKNQLGVKYFVPDPINGGNSNTGPQIAKILKHYKISALIFEISPELLLNIAKCCYMLKSTSFVNVDDYDMYSREAFKCIMSELGNYGNLTANTHALICHGSIYIKYAQEELGVSLGALSGKD